MHLLRAEEILIAYKTCMGKERGLSAFFIWDAFNSLLAVAVVE